MAATKGTSVLVKVGTTTIDLTNNATLNFSINNADISSFGDTWKESLATVKEATISVSGTYDKSDSGQDTAFWTEILSGDGDIADFRLYVGANYWGGAFVLESSSITFPYDGVVTYSASLKSNGAISYT